MQAWRLRMQAIGGLYILLMLLGGLRQACCGELVLPLCNRNVVLCFFWSSARACLSKIYLSIAVNSSSVVYRHSKHGLQQALLSLAQVDLVLLPAVTGDFGVMPGHVPTVAQLRPGVVTVHHELDKAIEKFFVSSGFAFVHADSSTDVCAVEAVKLEDLDPEAVRAGLQVCILRV